MIRPKIDLDLLVYIGAELRPHYGTNWFGSSQIKPDQFEMNANWKKTYDSLPLPESPVGSKQGQTVHKTAIDREKDADRQKDKQINGDTENQRHKETEIQENEKETNRKAATQINKKRQIGK